MTRKILYYILLVVLLADLSYSFIQHYCQPLDGDMPVLIVPANEIKPVLNSPFGTDVLLKGQCYPNPNRFFCHWSLKEYFTTIPLYLQKFVGPIDSVYLACAIIKILIQIFIIILLATAITGTLNVFKLEFMIAAVLITPLFQTNGYRHYMGIIDSSITYTFFYALPCAFLLLYFMPFIQQYFYQKKPHLELLIKILWIPLAVILSLSGPLNPGIILVFSMLLIFVNLKNNYLISNEPGIFKRGINAIKMIPFNYWFYLFPICLFSLYSLYIGKSNLYNFECQLPLSELYLKLPEAIIWQFTNKLAFPVLFLIIALNAIFISKKYKTNEGKRIITILKWIGIFALIYILLLPLGGYRIYRPHILRYDTIMPITLSIMFIFGISTLYLFKNMTTKQRMWYVPFIIGVLLIFANSDEAQFDKNNCERIALQEIANSKDTVVQLQNDCTVLSWNKVLKPEESELSSQLLYIWKVTDEKKLYYCK